MGEDAFEGGFGHDFAEAGDGIVGDDAAFAQDEDGVRHLLDDFEDVGAVEDHALPGGEGMQQTAEDHGGVDVEAGEGFVEDEEFGVVEQGGEQENLLAHALGVPSEPGVAIVPEADEAEEFVHFGFEDAAGNAAQTAGELEVFAAAEVGIEVGLLGDVAEAALEALEVAADVLAVEEDASAGGLEEAGEHLDGGTFAGAVGAEIAEDLAGAYGEADRVDGGGPMKVLARLRASSMGSRHRWVVAGSRSGGGDDELRELPNEPIFPSRANKS